MLSTEHGHESELPLKEVQLVLLSTILSELRQMTDYYVSKQDVAKILIKHISQLKESSDEQPRPSINVNP